jgi:hypothetical protein
MRHITRTAPEFADNHASWECDTSIEHLAEDFEVVNGTEGNPKADKPPLFCVDPNDDRADAEGSGQTHESNGQPNHPTWGSWEGLCHITPPAGCRGK